MFVLFVTIYWPSILLGTVVVALISRLKKKMFQQDKDDGCTVPWGPKPWPIVGNLISLGRRPYETIYKWSKNPLYGPIFKLRFGSQTVVCLNSTKLIREALHENAEIFAGRPYLYMINETLHGKGIISAPYGKDFNEHKTFLVRNLNRFGRRRSSLENACLEEVKIVAEKIRDQHQTKSFSMGQFLSEISCNNICTITMGRYFDSAKIGRFLGKINENFNQTATIASFNFLPFTRWFQKKLFQNVADCAQFVQTLIKERETDFDEQSITNIVDSYIDNLKKQKIQSFSKENLDSLVQDLFVAGTETVSNTLNWAIFYVTVHSDIQQKIQNEIDKVIGKERYPCIKDRMKMPYTEAAILETMRCQCAGPILLPRSTTQDILFCNYYIPKDTFILVNMWSVMKDETYWNEPNAFEPRRFLNDKQQIQNNHIAMMPFSVGKRACVGEAIAKTQLFLVFTSLLQRFEFRFMDDWKPKDLQGEPGITLRPPDCKYMARVR